MQETAGLSLLSKVWYYLLVDVKEVPMNSTDLFVGLMVLLLMSALVESLLRGAQKRCGINGVPEWKAPLGASVAFLVLMVLSVVTLWSLLSSLGILWHESPLQFRLDLSSFADFMIYATLLALSVFARNEIALKLESFFWGAITPFAPDSEPA